MKKKVKIPNEGNGFKKLGIPYAPILKFGYPVVFDDDDNGHYTYFFFWFD